MCVFVCVCMRTMHVCVCALAHFGLNPKASNLNLAVFDALAHVGVPVHDRLVRCTRPDV